MCIRDRYQYIGWGGRSVPLISERKGTDPHWKHLRCTHFDSQHGSRDIIVSLACVRLSGWPVAWNWRRAVLSVDAGLLVRTVVQQLTRFQLIEGLARSLCSSWATCWMGLTTVQRYCAACDIWQKYKTWCCRTVWVHRLKIAHYEEVCVTVSGKCNCV